MLFDFECNDGMCRQIHLNDPFRQLRALERNQFYLIGFLECIEVGYLFRSQYRSRYLCRFHLIERNTHLPRLIDIDIRQRNMYAPLLIARSRCTYQRYRAVIAYLTNRRVNVERKVNSVLMWPVHLIDIIGVRIIDCKTLTT